MAEHQNIAAALIAAQQAFGQVIKNKRVDVATQKGKYSYTYATLGDTLDAVLPALHENGLALLQRMDTREGKPVVVTTLMHSGSNMSDLYPVIESFTPIIWNNGNAQDFGSGITYARRYGITALLCLAAEDDDGKAASTPTPKPKESVDQTTGEIIDMSRRRVDKPEPQPERDIQPPPPSQMNGPSKSVEVQAKQSAMNRLHALRSKLEADDDEVKEHMRKKYRPSMTKEEFTRNMLTVDELTEYGDILAAEARKRGLS